MSSLKFSVFIWLLAFGLFQVESANARRGPSGRIKRQIEMRQGAKGRADDQTEQASDNDNEDRNDNLKNGRRKRRRGRRAIGRENRTENRENRIENRGEQRQNRGKKLQRRGERVGGEYATTRSTT